MAMPSLRQQLVMALVSTTLWQGCGSSGELSVHAVKADAKPSRTVMAWMGWEGRTDAQLDEIVRYFISNTDAITTASPTSHALGNNGTLIERNLSSAATSTRAEVFKRLRAGGVRVMPTIWNDAGGMHTALLPKFLQLAAAPDAFIADVVALAVTEDLEGWNVDFELGAEDWDAGDCRLVWPDPRWGPRCQKIQRAATLFANFLDRFAVALHRVGKTLSVDIGTDTNPLCAPIAGTVPKIAKGCYSQWWMHGALNATGVDRFISMTTYQSFQHFVIGTASMLARFSDYHGSSRTGVAGPTTALGFLTGEHYSTLDLRRRFAVVEGLEVQELDIWFVDDAHGGVPTNWLPFLRQYLVGTQNETLLASMESKTGNSPHVTGERDGQHSQPSNRTAMVWMGWGHRTDALLDAEIAWFTAPIRSDLLTASPTCHTLGENGALQEWPLAKGANHTPISVWKKLRAGGVKVLPTIYNDANGYHATLLPRFIAMAANADQFIEEAVSLAVDNDLEGWNIDFEIGQADQVNGTLVDEASKLLVTFVDKFARALEKHGKVLSLDVETADVAWWNATALNASALSSMVDMSTYRNFADFIISLGIALLEWSPEKIGIGFGNGNRTETWLRERFEVIEGLGVHEVDIWFMDSLPKNLVPDDWLPHVQRFLSWAPENAAT